MWLQRNPVILVNLWDGLTTTANLPSRRGTAAQLPSQVGGGAKTSMQTNLKRQEWSGRGQKWGKTRLEGRRRDVREGEKNAELGSSCWGFPPLMYSPSFFFLTATVILLDSVHRSQTTCTGRCRPSLTHHRPSGGRGGERKRSQSCRGNAEAI